MQSATFGAVPTGLGAQVRQDFNLADQAAATEHEGAFAPSVTYPFMRWRNDAGKLLRRRNAGNSGWEVIENYGAVADPTVNDDAADGYIRGAMWINVAAGRLFFCTDATTGAAAWAQAGGGGGGVASVFGRTGAVGAQAGDYTADQISDGGGKVVMTEAERSTLARVSFPAKVIPLIGTGSSADNANIRAAIEALKASGQPGELLMSGDFMIGHEGDLSGIDPDSCRDLKLTGRGSCRWYKGVAATTTGLTGGEDPVDGTAYRLLARDIDDGPGKTLVIRNILFEGDLETTMKQLGDGSRLIALDHYDRVELIDVEGRWASQMAFTFGYCNQVRAGRIHLNRIARDGLNASNCADVAVSDSDFEWIIDDCCAANLSAVVAEDRGQQRAFCFAGNRVYNAQGVKVLGGKHVTILGNSFRAPLNYAVFLGDDASYGEGARPIEDVLVSANTVTDLVTADQYGNDNVVDTAIIASQFSATPHNVVIRGNILAQRTATTGLTWSQLKLRGIAGENRQWRQDGPTGGLLWYDPVLSEEIFVGQGKAVRVEAPNGLDRLTYDIDDNRIEGFSDDAFLRAQPAWAGDQLWTVPVSPGEFPVGAAARITGLDLRGYQDMRLVVTVGSPGGPLDAQLLWSFSLDSGATWTATLATVILDDANQTLWGPWQPIPAALRQTIDAQLALFGQGGNGSAQMRILEVALDVRGVDQTSAARLLPSKITPAEIADPVEIELRSFSPADVAAIAGGGPGGSTPAFGTIAVAGQPDVVADVATATLTLAAGADVTITTDPATGTIMIAADGGGLVASVFGRTGAVAGQAADYAGVDLQAASIRVTDGFVYFGVTTSGAAASADATYLYLKDPGGTNRLFFGRAGVDNRVVIDLQNDTDARFLVRNASAQDQAWIDAKGVVHANGLAAPISWSQLTGKPYIATLSAPTAHGFNLVSDGNDYASYTDAACDALFPVLVSAGFSHISCRVIWQVVEPTKGTYTGAGLVTNLLRVADKASQYGLRFILDFHTLFNDEDQAWQAPAWLSLPVASGGCGAPANHLQHMFTTAAVLTAFQDMQLAVTSQLLTKPALVAVSILNEPYVWPVNPTGINNAIVTLAAAHHAAHSVPISARLLEAYSPFYYADTEDKALPMTVAQALDIIGMNAGYADPTDPAATGWDGEQDWVVIGDAISWCRAHGKPFWVTEAGINTGTASVRQSFFRQQADVLATYGPDLVLYWNAQVDAEFFVDGAAATFNFLSGPATISAEIPTPAQRPLALATKGYVDIEAAFAARSAVPYDILCGIVGKPANGEVVLLFVAPRPFRIPANAASSRLKAGTAATGSSVFSIQKNGSEFLTAAVAASGTTATFAGTQTDFAAGDVLRIVAPAGADATLADIAITLTATLL